MIECCNGGGVADKLREWHGRKDKRGGGGERGVKYVRLPEKTGVLTGMRVSNVTKVNWHTS